MATTTIIANATQFITASPASFWTVSASVKGNLKEIIFNNTDQTTAYGVTVYHVPSGGTASAGNSILGATTVGAGTFIRVPFNTFLSASDQIQMVASTTNKITGTVSGMEYS